MAERAQRGAKLDTNLSLVSSTDFFHHMSVTTCPELRHCTMIHVGRSRSRVAEVSIVTFICRDHARSGQVSLIMQTFATKEVLFEQPDEVAIQPSKDCHSPFS